MEISGKFGTLKLVSSVTYYAFHLFGSRVPEEGLCPVSKPVLSVVEGGGGALPVPFETASSLLRDTGNAIRHIICEHQY